MPQAPRELTPYESAAHFFGAELRHWRTTRGLSHARLGAMTHYSGHTIGKIEIAARRPTPVLARCLDAVLDTGGVFERLLPMIQGTRTPPRRADPEPEEHSPDDDLGLAWDRTPADTVRTVTGLWRADMKRRAIINTVWLAAALSEPLDRWLRDPVDGVAGHTGTRRVGQADIDGLWTMSAAFADADHQLGGGYARATLVHYAEQVVTPLLEGSYSDTLGRRLFAAAARLCDIAGFMCFDSGRQGLGQKYLLQALRMAKISGDRALGGHILADLSMQAHYLRRPVDAIALAEAAVACSAKSGSASTLARCHAIRARALALGGETKSSDHALNEAERALSHANPENEPFWIRFFTPQQLATESMYIAADLQDRHRVRHHARDALTPNDGMRRRQVLATTTLAGTYLPTDVDQACHILGDVLPTVGSLTSARALTSINRIRRRLAPFADRPTVRLLEDDLHHALAAT